MLFPNMFRHVHLCHLQGIVFKNQYLNCVGGIFWFNYLILLDVFFRRFIAMFCMFSVVCCLLCVVCFIYVLTYFALFPFLSSLVVVVVVESRHSFCSRAPPLKSVAYMQRTSGVGLKLEAICSELHDKNAYDCDKL
jgi:hypothetical protein